MVRLLFVALVVILVGCTRRPRDDAPPPPSKPTVEAPPVPLESKPVVAAPPKVEVAQAVAPPKKPVAEPPKPQSKPIEKPAVAAIDKPAPKPIVTPPAKPMVAAIDKSPKPAVKKEPAAKPIKPDVAALAQTPMKPTRLPEKKPAAAPVPSKSVVKNEPIKPTPREKKPEVTPAKSKVVAKTDTAKSPPREKVKTDALAALDREPPRVPGQSPFSDAKPVVTPPSSPKKSEPPAVKNGGKLVRSGDVFELYKKDEAAAERAFGGIVNVGGVVNRVTRGQVTLVEKGDRDGTRCTFRDAARVGDLKEGDRVLIRGRCAGMTFGTLVLEDCELIQRVDSELEFSRLFPAR